MKRKQTKQTHKNFQKPKTQTQTFISHVRELRRRLIFVAAFVVVFSGLGALLLDRITQALLRPAQNQHFIYTSPGGGFDFNFRISLYFGIALSIPIAMYQLFRFLEPLITNNSRHFVVRIALFSWVMALCGVLFGYFVGLPAALNFLLHQFQTEQITALLTIQEYMSFVLIYLVGFALLFQIPLVMLFFNRIKPLQPRKLFGYQKFVIVGAAIIGALLSPTADIINQLLMSVPIIGMYQLGVGLVWAHNRKRRPKKVELLYNRDQQIQQERLERLTSARPLAAQTKTEPLKAPSTPAFFAQQLGRMATSLHVAFQADSKSTLRRTASRSRNYANMPIKPRPAAVASSLRRLNGAPLVQ